MKEHGLNCLFFCLFFFFFFFFWGGGGVLLPVSISIDASLTIDSCLITHLQLFTKVKTLSQRKIR